MKRLFCCALAMLCLCLSGTGLADEAADFMTQEGCKLAWTLQACALDETYMAMFVAPGPVTEAAAALGQGMSTVLHEKYRIEIDRERILAENGISISGFPALAQQRICQSLVNAVPTRLCSVKGSAYVAAGSLLQLGETCLCPEGLTDSVCLLLTFGGNTAAVCVFAPSGFGTVGCSAMLVPMDQEVWAELVGMEKDGYCRVTEME